jgi:transcriptional regulator with XRE-family HTH domain
VKSYSYHERDYAFGQLILTLRMHLGLTQASLAEVLHIHRRAIAGWEAGSSYPKADHLKQLIALGGGAASLCCRARGRGDPRAVEGGASEGAAG